MLAYFTLGRLSTSVVKGVEMMNIILVANDAQIAHMVACNQNMYLHSIEIKNS
jgi:hypothetical protein